MIALSHKGREGYTTSKIPSFGRGGWGGRADEEGRSFWQADGDVRAAAARYPPSEGDCPGGACAGNLYGKGIGKICLSERYFSKMELYLLERYAILLEADGRQAEAVLWYRAIIQYLDDEEYDLADRYSLYPVMAYQLAKYYGEQRRKEEAFWYIARGCEMLGRRKNQLALFCRLTELKFLLEDAREGEVKPDHREREEYRSLCGSKTLKEAGFLDNWYPMYREKHLICFNDLVRERRLAAGMSKTELAYGIFAERTLERMEARKNTPRALAREKLLQKLKLPMEKYNAGIVTVRYQDYRKVGRLEMLCQEGKYREAREIYRELQRCIDLKNLTNQQWAEYWDIRIADGLGHLSPGMKGERLWALLQKTVPIKRGCPQFECQLMRNERYVLNQIANGIVPEKTKMKKILLNQIKIFYQKREKKLFDPEYLIQMFVQLGNAVREEKNYPLALRYLHMAQKRWKSWMSGIFGNTFCSMNSVSFRKRAHGKVISNVPGKRMRSAAYMQKTK